MCGRQERLRQLNMTWPTEDIFVMHQHIFVLSLGAGGVCLPKFICQAFFHNLEHTVSWNQCYIKWYLIFLYSGDDRILMFWENELVWVRYWGQCGTQYVQGAQVTSRERLPRDIGLLDVGLMRRWGPGQRCGVISAETKQVERVI